MERTQRREASANNSPTAREIAAFVDARRSSGIIRRSALALRLRIPTMPHTVRAVLIVVIAWVGVAQWAGFVIRLLRMAVEG